MHQKLIAVHQRQCYILYQQYLAFNEGIIVSTGTETFAKEPK